MVELSDEKRSLKGRTGSVTRRLHEARMRMAHAAGLDPMEDLPFVAELIDVLPDEEHWRKAVETTLGGITRVVLVDRRSRDKLSAAIDGLTISPRIHFHAVDLSEHEEWRGDPDRVSGKLAFKDSPYSRWVQDRVSDTATDHLCVPNTATLNGPGPRVTPAGQTRDGDKGAHGGSADGNIIGFSNKRRLADIEEQLIQLEPQMSAVNTTIDVIRTRLADLRKQRSGHLHVHDTVWADIDHLGIDRQIIKLNDEIQRIRTANTTLDALEKEEERVTPLHHQANRARVLAENHLRELESTWGELLTQQDTVQDTIDAIDDAQTTTVTNTQQLYLDALLADTADTADTTNLKSFNANIRAVRKRLKDDADTAHRAARAASTAMESMFEAYKTQWTEHNLGTTAASADGYRDILNRIQSEGLYKRHERWRREFAAWSSDDLLRLNDAFDSALEDIEDRLTPINRILSTVPFGGKGVLQINLRRLQSEDLSTFRRGLRELSSGLALELTDQQVETRFTKLRDFMNLIQVPEGHPKSSTSQRDRYLDVRQHVVITAVCLDAHHREIATYDSLGGKSGGESQELVAFIVGSALRYQLGDETRSRPTFAPVFVDEGFIKSDGDFAGRSVKAWQNLGFQLIIGAPLDKVTALEPHMDLLLTVTKNTRDYPYINDILDAPNTPDAA